MYDDDDDATQARLAAARAWSHLPAIQEALRLFSPAARAVARAEVFDRRVDRDTARYAGSCGLCVGAVLLRHDFPAVWGDLSESQQLFPAEDEFYGPLGLNDPAVDEAAAFARWETLTTGIDALIELNDLGELATPGAVAQLFAGL